jgi:glycosyltransferase involved in cell wall biosynthesis
MPPPPTLSVVIPSYQQAAYLESAILSVLDQGYPRLELIVIDGGSTDGSVDVLKKFDAQLSYWVSEPDEGQTDAINKGLEIARGEVWSYLNSDDLLEPGGLQAVADHFTEHPESNWLSGSCRVFGDETEEWILAAKPYRSLREVLIPWERTHKYVFPQSGACFMRRRVWDRIGRFDASYHYSMDMEYYTRALFEGQFEQVITDRVLAAWRWHPAAKTTRAGMAFGFREDEIRIAETYLHHLPDADRRELKPALRSSKRDILVRKAVWSWQQGDRAAARSLLTAAFKLMPSSLLNRPWLGAWRRVLFH